MHIFELVCHMAMHLNLVCQTYDTNLQKHSIMIWQAFNHILAKNLNVIYKTNAIEGGLGIITTESVQPV